MNEPIFHDEFSDVTESEFDPTKDEQIQKAANKYLNKHKREIKRLQEHAEHALLVNNPDAYVYAIGKLREISKQPKLDRETMNFLFLTSKQKFDELMRQAIDKVMSEQES